jgi:site-specific recombinase XerD
MRAPQVGFDQLVQDFFLRRLIEQRGARTRTVESYRDAFELLFGYLEDHLGKPASALTLVDLDAPVILDFLEHLETVRRNSARAMAQLPLLSTFMGHVSPASTYWYLSASPELLAAAATRLDPSFGSMS